VSTRIAKDKPVRLLKYMLAISNSSARAGKNQVARLRPDRQKPSTRQSRQAQFRTTIFPSEIAESAVAILFAKGEAFGQAEFLNLLLKALAVNPQHARGARDIS